MRVKPGDMNDPWDVKSVRQSTQYISCLKLNGVPLLPPVLSQECRKEMQYYKLLAKEVERRINLLKRYVTDSETESTEDKTDAPELPPDFEQLYEDKTDCPELEKEEIETDFDVNLEKITAYTNLIDKSPFNDISYSPDLCKSISNLTKTDANHRLSCQSPKFLFDVSLNIIESGKDILEKVNSCQTLSPQPTDPPERDYNNTPKKNTPNKNKKELLTDVETFCNKNKRAQNDGIKNMLSLNFNQSDPFPDMGLEDGPASLGAKSFTGSLNNIHRESLKVSCKLIRQRSYTVLNPSPQLLAHLKVQSMNTGVDVTSISMSESQSNLGITKKRRSWDLESAKVKWSSMALELKSKTAVNNANKNQIFRNVVNKNRVVSPPRSRSVMQDRSRRGSLPNKSLPKTEPIQKAKKSLSPLRNSPSNRTIVKEPISISSVQNSPQSPKQKAVTLPVPNKPTEQKLVSDSEDPAARVRELYEKIQNQQLIQMANLVEKQKKEQMLLQQVFEEQNSILYKQLKTICPATSIEPKEAWGDKLSTETPDRGPVSLSQLMSLKSEKHADRTPPLTSMLTETHNQINKCDMILRKSRDMTSSLRKQQTRRSPSDRSGVAHSPRSPPDGSRTRTHSPNLRHTSIARKLNYDTSASSDKEFEPMLTDRTNDTLAGLNVSFPTDSEVSSGSVGGPRNEVTMIHCPAAVAPRSSTDSAIRSLEDTIHNSINSTPTRKYQPKSMNGPPTPQQRAAAVVIVAHAKGYLVRRLMRTERVQATVQTIKDALLCALQLHQDRAGIRGADVDLHRRLIQQITAACYSLHDTFVASTPAERCALVAADRERRRQKPPPVRHVRQKSDIMSQSHSGAFTTRSPRAPAALMTQSNHETFSGEKGPGRYMPSLRRRPWR